MSQQSGTPSLRTPYTRWERCITDGTELASLVNAELDKFGLNTMRTKPVETATVSIVTARQFMSARTDVQFDSGALATSFLSRTDRSPCVSHDADVLGYDFLRGNGTNRRGLRIALLLAAPAVMNEISEVNDLLKSPPYSGQTIHVSFRKVFHPGTIEQMQQIAARLTELTPPIISLEPITQKQVAADGSETTTTLEALESDFLRRQSEEVVALRSFQDTPANAEFIV